MNCPICAAPLDASHTNTQRGLAICDTCDTIFSLPDAPPHPAPDLGPRHDLQAAPQDVTIRTRWWSPNLWPVPALSALWAVSAVIWLGSGLASGDLFITLSGIPHATIALGLAYYSATLYRNTTTTYFSPDGLRMTHGPLPLARNVHARQASIQRVYARQRYHRRSDEFSYGVYIRLASGRDEALLTGLPEPEAALYLVDTLRALWENPEKVPEKVNGD
ncbi:MAG: hypothetical protein ACLFTK_00640 [Anaerolineales bacterium]